MARGRRTKARSASGRSKSKGASGGGSSVQDIDLGWNKIVKDTKIFSKLEVKFGMIEGDSNSRSNGSGNFTNAEIGAINEFGSADGTIPERSWLRKSSDHFQKQLADLQQDLYSQINSKRRVSVKKGLDEVGQKSVKLVQQFIRQVGPSQWESLDPATIDAKGSATILDDTGEFIRSISHEVQRKSA